MELMRRLLRRMAMARPLMVSYPVSLMHLKAGGVKRPSRVLARESGRPLTAGYEARRPRAQGVRGLRVHGRYLPVHRDADAARLTCPQVRDRGNAQDTHG